MTELVQVVDQTRGTGLGASQAGAALGMSPYLSPVGLWMQIRDGSQSKAGAPAEWGQILEPVIRGYYAARHGYDTEAAHIHVPTESLYHPEHAWLRATPDGIVREGGADRKLVQVKTVDWRIAWHWGLDKRHRTPPPHYRVQSVVEMAVTGLSCCDFAVLSSGSDYFECIVERDPELEGMVVDGLVKFWACVQTGTPPDLDESAEWRAYFADRLPKQRIEYRVGPEFDERLDQWLVDRREIEAATKRIDLVKNQALALASDNNATVIVSDKHGAVPVVQSKNKAPYVKAPALWGMEES